MAISSPRPSQPYQPPRPPGPGDPFEVATTVTQATRTGAGAITTRSGQRGLPHPLPPLPATATSHRDNMDGADRRWTGRLGIPASLGRTTTPRTRGGARHRPRAFQGTDIGGPPPQRSSGAIHRRGTEAPLSAVRSPGARPRITPSGAPTRDPGSCRPRCEAPEPRRAAEGHRRRTKATSSTSEVKRPGRARHRHA